MRLLVVSSILTLSSLISAQPLKAQSDESMGAQIWGGEKVKPGELPSTVYVRGSNFACTGSLIKPDVVLTAAHCVASSGMYIRANSLSATTGGNKINVKRGLQHEQYRGSNLKYDIGLLFLSEPVPNAQPITIKVEAPNPGDTVYAAGWGVTETGRTSDALLKVELKVGDTRVCGQPPTGTNFCYVPVAGKGICFGDSGGPVYKIQDGKNYILGVSSYISKNQCGQSDTKGYFNRAGYHIEWIRKNAGVGIAQQ
ncbi:uncharacterized protein VTP21DRAFT_7790 [Calcarisporiella thermophila]|uniref:uncharacterized protein n=1 Tax=Calcarisporiella thermophila TaxID=911321 RepID=UPI0037436CB1